MSRQSTGTGLDAWAALYAMPNTPAPASVKADHARGGGAPASRLRKGEHTHDRASTAMQELTNRVAQLTCDAPATPGIRAARAIVEEAAQLEATGGAATALAYVREAKRTPGLTLKPVIQYGTVCRWQLDLESRMKSEAELGAAGATPAKPHTALHATIPEMPDSSCTDDTMASAMAGAAAARVHGGTPPATMLTPTFSGRLHLDALAHSQRGRAAAAHATPGTADAAAPAPQSALRAPPVLHAGASPTAGDGAHARGFYGTLGASAHRRSASASSISRHRPGSLAGGTRASSSRSVSFAASDTLLDAAHAYSRPSRGSVFGNFDAALEDSPQGHRCRVRSVDAGATPRPRSSSHVSFSRTNEMVTLATPEAATAATPPPSDRRLSLDAGVTPRRSRAGVVSFSAETTTVQLAPEAAAPAATTDAERRSERQRSLSAGATPRRSRESVVAFAEQPDAVVDAPAREATLEPDGGSDASRRSMRAGHTPRHSGASVVSFSERPETIAATPQASPGQPDAYAPQCSLHAGATPRRPAVQLPAADDAPAVTAVVPRPSGASSVSFSTAPPAVVATGGGDSQLDVQLGIPEEHSVRLSLHAGATPNPSRPASPSGTSAVHNELSAQQRTAAEQQPLAGAPVSGAPDAPGQLRRGPVTAGAVRSGASGAPGSTQRQVAAALQFASAGGEVGFAGDSVCDSALAADLDRSPWVDVTPQVAAPLLHGALASGATTTAQPSTLRRAPTSHQRPQRPTPAASGGGSIFTFPSPHPAAVPASTRAAQSAQQRMRSARGGFMSPAGTYYAFEGTAERAQGSALAAAAAAPPPLRFDGEQGASMTPSAFGTASTPTLPATQLQMRHEAVTPGEVDQTAVFFQGFGGLADPLSEGASTPSLAQPLADAHAAAPDDEGVPTPPSAYEGGGSPTRVLLLDTPIRAERTSQVPHGAGDAENVASGPVGAAVTPTARTRPAQAATPSSCDTEHLLDETPDATLPHCTSDPCAHTPLAPGSASASGESVAGECPTDDAVETPPSVAPEATAPQNDAALTPELHVSPTRPTLASGRLMRSAAVGAAATTPGGGLNRELRALLREGATVTALVAEGGAGRRELLAPVSASAAQRAKLGSTTVLTPVRRSVRHEGARGDDVARQLELSEWAYAHNAAIPRGTEDPRGHERAVTVKSEGRALEDVVARMHGLKVEAGHGLKGEAGCESEGPHVKIEP